MHADNSEPQGRRARREGCEGNRFNLSPGQRMGFPCGTSLPRWGGTLGSWTCLLPPFHLQLPEALCPSVHRRAVRAARGHSVWDQPRAGDAPVHPDPAVCSCHCWCHQPRLSMAPLAAGSSPHCCVRRGWQPPACTGGSPVPAAHASLCVPAHVCPVLQARLPPT